MFLHLVDTHEIQMRDTSQSPATALSAEVHRLLIEAGHEAIEVANQRYRLIEAYRNKQREGYAGKPTRTIRDWLAHFRDAEAAYGYGYGYVGLLPKTAARGNRTPKATEESRRFLDEAIAQWYARPKQQKAREVFVAYQRTCLEHQVPAGHGAHLLSAPREGEQSGFDREAQGSKGGLSGEHLALGIGAYHSPAW